MYGDSGADPNRQSGRPKRIDRHSEDESTAKLPYEWVIKKGGARIADADVGGGDGAKRTVGVI